MSGNRLMAIWTSVLVLVFAFAGCTAAQPEIDFAKGDKRIDISIDGKPFTSYVYGESDDLKISAEGILLTKPVLYPLRTPSGVEITRGYPFKNVEGEKQDHPHHIGLYFTYDEVNDSSFWNNSKNVLPKIEHLRTEKMKSGKGEGALTTVMNWVGVEGKPLLQEKRKMTVIAEEGQNILDFDISLTALKQKVEFGDTKEGMFAIRLAQWLTESTDKKYTLGTGRYLSSNGDETEKNSWGKRARWIRIEGQKDGKAVGVAILNHPTSINYPTYWHNRGYGCFSANSLGQYAFQKGRKVENPKAFGLTLEPGQSATFRFRVLLYDGPRTKAQIEKEFARYAK